MAPRPSAKRQKRGPSDLDEKSLPSSSDPTAEDMFKTARNVLSASEKRRAIKRISIEERHEKKMKDVGILLDSLFETRKHHVTKIQIVEWEKLETLNKRRMELESRILSTMRSMERHTMNICNELSAIFEGRIEEIKGSLSAER